MEEALSSSTLINSSNFVVDHEIDGEDSWVVIKKQRITILVPPPSPTAAPSQTENPIPKRSCNKSSKAVMKRSNTLGKKHHRCSKIEVIKPLVSPSEHGLRNNDSIQASEKDQKIHSIPPTRVGVSPAPAFKIRESMDHFVGKMAPQQAPSPRGCNYGYLASSEKHISRTSRSLLTSQELRKPLIGTLKATNQRMRASNLERKIERFGGLKSWLSSCGLVQFVPFFEMENLDKYQLVNLTMSKLKDMGANAVGPRRKLIHAIDYLCQPHCLKAL